MHEKIHIYETIYDAIQFMLTEETRLYVSRSGQADWKFQSVMAEESAGRGPLREGSQGKENSVCAAGLH